MQSIEFPNVEFPGRKECIDLSDYCRLCLQLPDESDLLDLQLIYDEEENLSYYECFTICTQLDLRAGGTYAPHQLCKSCGLELQVAYDFHKKVEESKKFLVQFEKSATSNNVVEAPVVTMPSEVKSIQQRFAVEMVEGNVDNIHYETRILPLEPLESGTVPEPLESEITKEEEDVTSHLQTSMEYEELEEQVDMLDEYQSVDELVDEEKKMSKIQQVLAHKIEQLISKTDRHDTELISLRNEVSALNAKVFGLTYSKPKTILLKSPLHRIEDFAAFEENLKNEKSFKELVMELVSCTEKSYDKFIRSCWRQIMTDDVAKECSWRGTETKLCVKSFLTTLALRTAFKQKFALEDADFDRVTQKYFQYAQDRKTKADRSEYKKMRLSALS